MAVDRIKEEEQAGQKTDGLEQGTYEVIRKRLVKQGADLKERLDKLNSARKNVFGSIDTTITGSERIITENNCIPRDIAPVGTSFLFGYNVHIGLKSKTEPGDVFSVCDYKDHSFKSLSLELVQDKQFINDFDELYKYYKNTFFAKFTVIEPYLYMIFQTGKSPTDIKAFKWLVRDGKLTYVDNRSDHEVRLSGRGGLEWTRVRREDHREGKHPHISIKDKVFVETIGGDLTIKVENNTDTGKGIYSESVENKEQTLDDAEIFHAVVGHLILLKIRPYRENDYRYFVFNEKLQNVVRLDEIKDACTLLPDEHGLLFPKGYYLKSGEYKIFDVPSESYIFEHRMEASNGEDYQFIFYSIDSGLYLIYSYNIIEQTVETPIICSGYSHFQNGEMIVFKAEDEPRKNHMVQIWQTPFLGKDAVNQVKSDSILSKIGNKEIVHCMADCRIVYNLIQKGEGYASIYLDIVKETAHITDSFFWLDKEEAFNIREVLSKIQESAASLVAEYEKVTRIKRTTQKQIEDTAEKSQILVNEVEYGHYNNINEYVGVLENLRVLRGEIVSLKDLRYTDLARVEELEKKVREKNDQFSARCVEFLLKPEGLKPYQEGINAIQEKVLAFDKTSAGKDLEKEVVKMSGDMEMLIDIVNNFKIEDPMQTTEIIENISAIYSSLNQVKAKLKLRMDELAGKEGTVQFNSQLKLLNQAVANYIDIADSVEKCDEYLTKVMVQIEELEGKYSDFEEFVIKLAEKREELYSAFEAKKQSLLDRKNKKLTAIMSASERLLKGIANRLASFNSINEINGYFATDMMIEKVRDNIEQLIALKDTVKADEIQARLKTIKEEAVRQLKDKQELFVDGKSVIRFGRHSFSVNTQQLDLSIVQKEDRLYAHISGTDFWDEIEDKGLYEFRQVWDQSLPSENQEVCRAEYLAYKMYEAAQNKEIESIEELSSYSDQQLLERIQKYMEPRYQEAYAKGIHDNDCFKILKTLINLHSNIDLLTYSSSARALAQLFWNRFADNGKKEITKKRLKELAKVAQYYKTGPDLKDFIPSGINDMEESLSSLSFLDKKYIPEAAEYLCKEIMRRDYFVISMEAEAAYNLFMQHLKAINADRQFEESLKTIEGDIEGLYWLLRQWLNVFFTETGHNEGFEVIDEIIVMMMLGSYNRQYVVKTGTKLVVSGLAGSHPVIKNGEYSISYTTFIEKLRGYEAEVLPQYLKYQELRKDIIQRCRGELKLDELKTGVLSSFVRNKLIDKVYLPLIGDNLAKQIGVAGEEKRTDLMGMLLLISPPGYGKTTLVEYIASRLGITLIKINGPAIGNEITSLDPAIAKNASAKEELRKLNMAFKMGNNVLIYLDDIQHCNPEFLQKFIPLCDGQRKIEGVYKGVGQTFDLRGKKVAVVMAGNPYTESGEKFKIPDMLSNRADVYNLGDMIRENEEAFMLSYIENSLTSNPVLNKLAARSRKDIYSLIDIAKDGMREGLDFEGSYSAEEINEYVSVIQKLFKVRDVVLKINMEYIRSAAQADEYRKEPPFKLQGSYRNMNRIAGKIVPVMDDREIDELILGAYENDAQTLTTGAEANLLKWKEITGCLSGQEDLRWQEIKGIYNRNKLAKSDDKIGQAVVKLGDFGDKLEMIKDILAQGMAFEKLVEAIRQLKDALDGKRN